ncbi:protein of unknown function (plasmid) [Azospirillum baldaniorum]|uniref:Uncharacterized protein n=1 Tax=Azospirillum baldaniorum TaxID=1064539 RepID=A0A9P1NQG4_9PROT|nr:protein of unknown function [Azospirillum baldaniorum]
MTPTVTAGVTGQGQQVSLLVTQNRTRNQNH